MKKIFEVYFYMYAVSRVDIKMFCIVADRNLP